MRIRICVIMAPQGSVRVGFESMAVTTSTARSSLEVLQVPDSIAVRSREMSFVGGRLK